ncbi:MAG TPA: wax ester/triacylglycerol synthase family O-acyltransferase [Acidimicrobiales bacterium]|nr:wax ester/triacylglycerol synthase family O-acyltransferase [Acidimicrobiales bacterium]
MERLSGMDASFLYFETRSMHLHVAMTAIFDPSSMPGGYEFGRVRDFIASRLHLVPPFRRRVVQIPFRLHHPVWVEDPDFDLDYHVRRVGAPAPGGYPELAELASQIAGTPLDRSRPLWELYVVEGLADGNIGLIAKVHHCAVDGVSGAELMVNLFDLEPEGRDVAPPEARDPEPIPSEVELVAHAVASRARKTLGLLPLLGTTARTLGTLASRRRDPDAVVGALPLTAPRTPWNTAITPHRRMAFGRLPLEEVKRIKRAAGTTVNDVVLALVGGALRRYLSSRGGVPEQSLVAACPVSVRTEEQRGANGNRISVMFTSLATQVEDPLERLRTIARSTRGAKEDHRAIGATFLQDWAEHAAPATFALAARLYSSLGLASGHRPIHNVVVSNVPGPPFPLYFNGARLVGALPMGPIMEGAGLNITLMSYLDHLDVGFVACRELVPDVWDLVGHVEASLDELSAAVDARPAPPPAADGGS